MSQARTLTDLLDRLARLHLASRRDDALNPAQAAALDYLARANRFSRMPSAVADYLAATRGTVSQTLKALAAKSLIVEQADPADGRARRYDLTDSGRALAATLHEPPGLALSADETAAAIAALQTLLTGFLSARGGRSFGLCHSCRHHGARNGAPYCRLLDLPLAGGEPDQICREHEAA